MRRRLARSASAAVLVLLVLVVAGCVGSSTTPSPPGGAGPQIPAEPTPSATSRLTASPTATATAATSSPSEAAREPIDFSVSGALGGKQLAGKVTNGAITLACQRSGTQVLSVHWTGTASGTGLQGEIDFKPGTWTIGSATAQGSASIGLLGGKAADSLGASSGTVTSGPTGGSIDATFADGGGPVHLSGTWTCPKTSASF
jgi:hypothetical protein